MVALGGSRIERQLDRELAKIDARGAVLTATERTKVQAVADVTACALMATSHVSAVEALMIERTPHAEARLRHIADAGCAGMSNVVLTMAGRI